MKVLLVEDDPILTQMYQDEFKKSEVELIVEPDGKLGVIEAAKQKPDFILLDVMMPGMNGITAFKHLKQMPETKHIPIAFLTVVPHGVPQTLGEDPKMLEAAVGYWSKDKYTPMEIVSMIKDYLDKSA